MITHIFSCVKAANPSAFRRARGGTADECKALESAAGVPLPSAYADFIALMGRSAGVELARDYDFSILTMINYLRKAEGKNIRLPVGVGGEPDSISLSLRSPKTYNDPPVYFSWDHNLEVDPDLVVAPKFSIFLARALFCEGLLKHQKYVSSIVPVVTPLYLRLVKVVDIDREMEALLTGLGAQRFFGTVGYPAYAAEDGYICYVRWPSRRTFAVHIGSGNSKFSRSVQEKIHDYFKFEVKSVVV